MIAYMAVWLVQMSICLFGTVVTARRSEEFLPAGMLGMVLLTYVCGLLGGLWAGVWLSLAAGLGLGVWAVVLVLTKRRAFHAERFFTPAFFAYIVLLALSAWISFGRAVVRWDECSHWAISVKSMIDVRDFSTNAASHILFRSYPPGVTIVQYLYQALNALFTGARFSEWLLYGAYNAYCFALLAPCLRFIKRTAWLYTPLLAALLALVPLCLFDEMYASLYVDMLLGVTAAYALSLFCTEARGGFDILARCLALMMLVLTKDAGLYFAAALPLYFFFSDWVALGRPALRPGRLLPFGAYALSVAFAKGSWARIVRLSDAAPSFGGKFDIGLLWRVVTGAEQGYQRTIFENYFKKFFSPIIEFGGVGLSFFMLFAGMALVTLLLYVLIARKEGVKRRALGPVLAPLCITAGYILGLCAVYLFKFDEYEGVALASYARYIKIAYVMWALILAGGTFVFLVRWLRRPLWPAVCLCCAALGLGLAASDLAGLLTRASARRSVEEQAPCAAAAAIAEDAAEPDARIYVLTQEREGYEYYLIRYLLYPRRVNPDGFSVGRPFYEGDLWTVKTDIDSWRATLITGYDYVLVYRANDFLNEDFGALFIEGARDDTLYRVDKTDGTLRPAG